MMAHSDAEPDEQMGLYALIVHEAREIAQQDIVGLYSLPDVTR